MGKSNNPVGRPCDRSRDDIIAAAISRGSCMRHIIASPGVGYYAIKRVEKERGLTLKRSDYAQGPRKPKVYSLSIVGNERYREIRGIKQGLSNW